MTFDPRKDPSCVLFLQFAERSGLTAYDLSKYGNHGTIYGAVRGGGFGRYFLSFDGVDDYVKVENSPSLEPQNLTVIGLLNPKSLNCADIICKYEGYAKGWRMIWSAGGNQKFLTEISYGDAGPKALYTGKSYDLGIHMVGFTYDHNNIKNYVDGQLDGTLAETRDINYTNSEYLTIGARDSTPDFPLNGDIYLVAIYNEAKSDDWIRDFYAWATSRLAQKIPSRYVPRGLEV